MVSKSVKVGMKYSPRYLHYWFHNSGLDTAYDFSQQKAAVLQQQLLTFQTERMGNMILSGNTQEGIKLLNELSASSQMKTNLYTAMNELFIQPPTGSVSSGIGDQSFASIGNTGRSVKKSREIIGELAAALESSQKAAQSALDDVVLTMSKAYPSVVEMVKTYFAANPTLSGGETNAELQAIFQQAIQTGTQYITVENVAKGQSRDLTLANEIARLQVLVDLIPEIENTSIKGLKATYSHTKGVNFIRTRSQLLAVLLGKISGHLNFLGGTAEEIAAIVGYEESVKKIAQELQISHAHTGLDIKADPNIAADAKDESTTFVQRKNDASFVVSSKDVELSYGLSVKKISKAKKYAGTSTAKVHSEANAWKLISNAMSKGLVTEYQLYNIAGGHEAKKETGLLKQWRSLMDYVVAANFLDLIAGKGVQGDNVLAMVVNRQLIPLSELLGRLPSSPDAISYSGAKKRDIYYKLNVWQGGKENQNRNIADALKRSAQAKQDIRTALQGAKITVNLNFAALNYKL